MIHITYYTDGYDTIYAFRVSFNNRTNLCCVCKVIVEPAQCGTFILNEPCHYFAPLAYQDNEEVLLEENCRRIMLC